MYLHIWKLFSPKYEIPKSDVTYAILFIAPHPPTTGDPTRYGFYSCPAPRVSMRLRGLPVLSYL
jgi:hypothetical protein